MSDLLTGIRVLESATLFNGDHLGSLLGDLGADVIKVESPFRGDYLRHFLGQITPGHSPAHLQINKNKRSVALDLRSEAGRQVFWRLFDTADVFVDGNAGDACDRLGIGYEAQHSRRASIVYCQYTGYGSSGPYARIPTHGQMMNALAAATPHGMGDDGFVHPLPQAGGMNGTASGGEGTAAGAIHAAFHVAAALVQAQRTGQGCYIDAAGSDGVIAQAWIAATYALNDHRITDRRTLPNPSSTDQSFGARYQFYETKDGQVVLFCCIEPKFWGNFCRAVDRPDLEFADPAGDNGSPVDFGVGQEKLRRALQTIFHTRNLAEWVHLAAEHDIAIGPAYRSLAEAKDDPHLRARAVIHEGRHPTAGPFTYIGEAALVAGQPYCIRYPAPELGEHTRDVLAELGLADEDIDRLAAERVI